MKRFPIIPNLLATTILKAFILNAIAGALIATLAIEARRELDNEKGRVYAFVNPFFAGDSLTEQQKAIAVAVTSLIGALVVYHFMYFLFGFGGGMLTSLSQSNNTPYA